MIYRPKTSTILFEPHTTQAQRLAVLECDAREEYKENEALKKAYPKIFKLCQNLCNYAPIRNDILRQLKTRISGAVLS